jgi:outer membrane protein assembly factor BamB
VAHWALAPDGAFFQVQNGTDFARIDPTTGRPLWSYPATSLRIFRAIAGANAVLLSGEFDAPTDFDFGPNQVVYQPRGPASSPSTAFIASYDANGALQWVREPTVFTTAEAIGRDGAIYGLTSYVPPELIDFDPGPAVDAILPVLGKGCYIVKYGP